LDMRLARLTGLERDKLTAEYEQLQEQIAYLTSLLNDEALLMGVIKDEMQQIRDKFADDRRTELTFIEGEIDIEDLIAPDDMVVTLTNFGYIKRLSKSTYRAQHRGGRGISGMTTRDEDVVRRLIIVNTHEEIMFFTDRGRVFSLMCYQIPEAGRTARGIAIVNLLALPGDEKVTAMIPVPRDDLEEHNLVMLTQQGYIKKTPYSHFANIRKNGLIALTLMEDDRLVAVELTDGKQCLVLGSRLGKAIRFGEEKIRPMGRTARGVHAMKLAQDDRMIDMSVIGEGQSVLAITEDGYGKRTDPDEYRETGRNGKGIIAMRLTDKTGPLVAQLTVSEEEDILLITNEGVIIRMAVSSISQTGRATQGVRLMRLDEGAKIVGVARAEQEEEEADEETAAMESADDTAVEPEADASEAQPTAEDEPEV
ncbi:MAG TPA: DNA gyrase C-terminal beta-propeller domain-containing protein, partial [Candidatus Limiplasma sp.]|nr:DNA gyrase C-terminal beta-propeller domain-containing protein [Candidatus Limiplasma sp.]